MRVRVHRLALKDRDDTIKYIVRESGDPRLGADFLDEYKVLKARIARSPQSWARYLHNTQKLQFKQFPYSGIVYRHTGRDIHILAVVAFNRKPGYWRRRK